MMSPSQSERERWRV